MIQLRAIFLPLFQRDAKLFELYCTKWRVKCKTRLLGCVRAGRSLTSARRSFAYKRALAPGIYCCLCNVYYNKALLLRARAQNFCSVSTLRRFSALSQDVEGSKVSGHDVSNICFDQKLPLSYFRIFRVGKMAWHLRVIFDHKVMSRSCQEIPI